MGEKTLFGRTGGAVTLAVGMADIFSAVKGRWLDLWYHFAIMFEALFILTTIDAGTRVGRYLLQDALGHLWKPLRQTGNSARMCSPARAGLGWGFFLIMGVRDPEGGVNALWPIFGISNQMLAAIALCLATTIILKMSLQGANGEAQASGARRPAFALITLLPLAWLLAATLTAGAQKIGHPDPRIGFLAQAMVLNEQLPTLEQAVTAAQAAGDAGPSSRPSARSTRIGCYTSTTCSTPSWPACLWFWSPPLSRSVCASGCCCCGGANRRCCARRSRSGCRITL